MKLTSLFFIFLINRVYFYTNYIIHIFRKSIACTGNPFWHVFNQPICFIQNFLRNMSFQLRYRGFQFYIGNFSGSSHHYRIKNTVDQPFRRISFRHQYIDNQIFFHSFLSSRKLRKDNNIFIFDYARPIFYQF